MLKRTVFFFLVFIITLSMQGKEKKKKISILPVPVIGYSPETKTYIGAVTLFTIKNLNDTLTRTSNAEIEFNYTWNKQLILESGWNYFLKGEEWFSRGIIHISKYPDLYYGIGANTKSTDEVNFQSNRFILDIEMFRKVKKNMFLGLGISYSDYSNIEYSNDILSYSELDDQNSGALKVVLLNENRNNILSATKGSYFEINNSFHFSSSFYFQTKMDIRKYYSFGENDNHTISSRFFHHSIIGTPAFYDYPIMGGDKFVRGYYSGRFRDRHFTTLQVEYRTNIFWKIGMATFGGISSVYNQYGNIDKNNFKPNVGLGLRFLIDKEENTSLRFDYAIGLHKQSGFYISFGESF